MAIIWNNGNNMMNNGRNGNNSLGNITLTIYKLFFLWFFNKFLTI